MTEINPDNGKFYTILAKFEYQGVNLNYHEDCVLRNRNTESISI